jgi:hypothetical protein
MAAPEDAKAPNLPVLSIETPEARRGSQIKARSKDKAAQLLQEAEHTVVVHPRTIDVSSEN